MDREIAFETLRLMKFDGDVAAFPRDEL